MKKTALIGTAILAVAISGTVALAVDSGGVYTALKVKNTDILLDGKLNDAGWKNAEVGVIDEANVPAWQKFKTHLSGGAAPKDAADISATFKIAYSDQYLFFGVDVKDDAFFSDPKSLNSNFDVVEIWLDGLGTGGGKHVSAKDAVLRLAAKALNDLPSVGIARMDTGKDAWKDENLALRPGVGVAGVVTKTGYIVEAAIAWEALEPWIGKHADKMGLDVQLNDNDTGKDAKGGGVRETALAWSGGGDLDWKDSNVFGTLLLK